MKRIVFFALSILLSITGISEIQGQWIGDTIHAVHYTINLEEINTSAHTISGWTEVTITPHLGTNIDPIVLELADLTVDAVEVDQVAATFTHNGERLEIDLANPLVTGDTILVKVNYHGEPFHESWGGFHFSGDYAFNLGIGISTIPHNVGKAWFPCIDDFTDRATYDVFGTAQTGLTVTAGGILIDTINNGNNTTTWHWNIPHPIPTYLASIAVGEYVEYTDEYYGIEDTIPINIFTKPASAGNVAAAFENIHDIMGFFETKFGPYPFEKIGYTGTAIGAMEHASNIALPHGSFNGGLSAETLITHELSHMWFGNKVTCSRAEDMWLNEGWATFCQMYYKTAIYDYEAFHEEMRETHKEVLLKAHIEDDGYWALNGIPQDVTYGMHAYDKGATVVNTLKNYLGDSLFHEVITAYLNEDGIAYHSVSSYDMRDFLTDYTGINMSSFFNAWVMTPGTPHFSIDSVLVTEENSSWVIDLWLKQDYKGANLFVADNIVEITMIDEDFNFFTKRVEFSGPHRHKKLIYDMATMPKKPIMVTMDLFEKTNDATTDDYSYFTEPETYEFQYTYFTLTINSLEDSALIRTTHNWVAPDSLKTPVEGLTLSPYRHWEIEGIIPDGFQAEGKFFYNTSGNLDNGLITSQNDSVVILYRSNAAHDWQEIPQTRVGVWMVGNIIVDNILPGEYTLAVWDKQIVGTKENKLNDNGIRIYPNPAREQINFEFSKQGNYHLKFYDETGKILDSINISSNSGSWDCSNKGAGIIMIQILENGNTLVTEKVVLVQ